MKAAFSSALKFTGLKDVPQKVANALVSESAGAVCAPAVKASVSAAAVISARTARIAILSVSIFQIRMTD
ncbi:MAG: hypothetical protein K2F88_04665 [Duncaniella sp.]|nr:hypothetical protein [Duncaniella sp.]